MNSVHPPLKQRDTLDFVIEQMEQRLQFLQEKEDYRAIFQHVYLLMTKEMQIRLAADFFKDPIWMEHLLTRFASYYFKAMDDYEKEKRCSTVWSLAFQMAEQKQTFVLQDALLGINAHINHDLPLVLYDVLSQEKAWPDARLMLNRRQDHERINDVLADLVDLVQEELATHHARLLRWVDTLMKRHDETLSSFFLAHCRTNVWYNTELLLNTTNEKDLRREQKRIDEDAYAIGLNIASFHSKRFSIIKHVSPIMRRIRLF